MKHGKKQFVLDENRRNTYKQFYSSAGGREPSVLTTFEGERKLLLPVCDLLAFNLLMYFFKKQTVFYWCFTGVSSFNGCVFVSFLV